MPVLHVKCRIGFFIGIPYKKITCFLLKIIDLNDFKGVYKDFYPIKVKIL